MVDIKIKDHLRHNRSADNAECRLTDSEFFQTRIPARSRLAHAHCINQPIRKSFYGHLMLKQRYHAWTLEFHTRNQGSTSIPEWVPSLRCLMINWLWFSASMSFFAVIVWTDRFSFFISTYSPSLTHFKSQSLHWWTSLSFMQVLQIIVYEWPWSSLLT